MSSELHPLLPYSSPSCSFINGSSLRDYHSLGVLNYADKMTLVMDENAPYFVSPRLELSADFSSGYLEDALLEFTDQHCKRRRLLPPCVDQEPSSHYKSPLIDIELEKSLWNFNPISLQPAENLDFMNQIESIRDFSDDEYRRKCMSRINEEVSILPETGTPEGTVSATESPDSSSSSYNKNPIASKTRNDTTIAEGDKRKKRAMIAKVAYPFALVKPGGREGDVTLNDINERILMRPTRPVRHPVGDFACRPCVSPEGPGLSGKEVVALTRIHTQGRGTITIIRTKG